MWWREVPGRPLPLCLLAAMALAACTTHAAPPEYRTNGERIFLSATSERGTTIETTLRTGPGERISCADCHRFHGGGGVAHLRLRSYQVPDICYKTLTATERYSPDYSSSSAGHGRGDHAGPVHGHPPYTEVDIARAIRQGVDPAGRSLEWPMTAWSMADEDLEDLIAH